MVPHFALCGTTIKADLHVGANQYYEHSFFNDQFHNTVQSPQPPLVAHNAKSSQSTVEVCRNGRLTTTPRRSSEQDGGLKGCAIVEQLNRECQRGQQEDLCSLGQSSLASFSCMPC